MELMTPQEWLDKAAWEGGLFEAFDYGLHPSEMDDGDPEFKDLLIVAHNLSRAYREAEVEVLYYAENQGWDVES